jgi:hypothetical protein
MYKTALNTYIFSPSDLVLFERSLFASWMARLEIDKPEQLIGIDQDQDKMMALLAYIEKILNIKELVTTLPP